VKPPDHPSNSTGGTSEVRVDPHEFEPLRRFRNKGRCRRCLLHERYHGRRLPNWPLSRAVGDDRFPVDWPDHFPPRAWVAADRNEDNRREFGADDHAR
jgi:hypothetical protein